MYIYNVNLYANWLLKWTRLSGAAGEPTVGKGISSDSAGNIYVTGYADGDLGSIDLTGT